MKAAVNASALVADLRDEAGSDGVEFVLAHGVISSVNSIEVVQKSNAEGMAVDVTLDKIAALGLCVWCHSRRMTPR